MFPAGQQPYGLTSQHQWLPQGFSYPFQQFPPQNPPAPQAYTQSLNGSSNHLLQSQNQRIHDITIGRMLIQQNLQNNTPFNRQPPPPLIRATASVTTAPQTSGSAQPTPVDPPSISISPPVAPNFSIIPASSQRNETDSTNGLVSPKSSSSSENSLPKSKQVSHSKVNSSNHKRKTEQGKQTKGKKNKKKKSRIESTSTESQGQERVNSSSSSSAFDFEARLSALSTSFLSYKKKFTEDISENVKLVSKLMIEQKKIQEELQIIKANQQFLMKHLNDLQNEQESRNTRLVPLLLEALNRVCQMLQNPSQPNVSAPLVSGENVNQTNLLEQPKPPILGSQPSI